MVTWRMAGKLKRESISTRNPDRTRERILAAALAEFSGRGFAGARVDAIARNASINKRMLYHYFGNKNELFRAVLHQKIAERQSWGASSSGNPEETLPFWFKTACNDIEWIRLLEWEALQAGEKVVDKKERQAAIDNSLERVRQRQERGQLAREFDPRHLFLTMLSLTMFPAAFPQLTRLIMGQSVSDKKFQQERAEFLEKFAETLRPKDIANIEIQFEK
jgi:AcrR family transcriptional regulator